MTEKIQLSAIIPDSLSYERLDQVAAQLFPDYSRSRLQTWIKKGELLVDGEQLRPRDKVAAGANLTIEATPELEVSWQGQEIELDIIYEDDSILVVNKPTGLVVHPAAGHADGTLVNALLNHDPNMANLPRAGIVHRLDMETTGIMVAAKSLSAHHHLVDQLQSRTVKRQYVAVCVGAMTGGGTVNEPMDRHPRQRKKMAVTTVGGKTAITHYRVVKRFAHFTQIAVNLETGRTHQIRVHMAHRRYPLIGDPLYGGRPRIPKGASAELIGTLRRFPRQALHAQELGLIHPESGEQVSFSCDLPEDMADLLRTLESEDPVAGRESTLY
ncbi:MAG: 23S rRNA pseudouridine1911/1915/1917 synthase [Halioglobus sp.]|jgi:23S rRNA pseudouridine1911/1915/1917 synthase